MPDRLPAGLAPIIVDVRYPRHLRTSTADAVERWWREMADVLAGNSALLGEHVDNPPLVDDAGLLDPAVAVRLLASRGVATIITVTGRDRDLAGAATMVQHYRDAGAAAVHCVTGDHPAVLGLTRTAIFGAESMTLLGVTREAGVVSTVAESPASPGERVRRVLAKQQAGAAVVILNHSGGAEQSIRFVDRCRDAGVVLPFVAPVPMVADVPTAHALEAFPGLDLPAGLTAAVSSAPDPLAEGIDMACVHAGTLAASGRFAGLNLSGGTVADDPEARIELTALFVEAVGSVWSPGGRAGPPR